MIGKVMKGRGFAGLARYLETGRAGDSPDRVEWVEARNLPTNDPETASLIMRATAAQSDRVQKPVYHIALSFDPDDGADQAMMIRVADRLLSDLGLKEHQALIVAHGDTAHAHVHLMVNRVHPETFRAWHPQHDYARIERSLRAQEHELALRAVPGHHYRLDGHELPDRSQALTSGQLRKWERTGEMPFDELVRNVARRHLLQATSWRDLEARLSQEGLRVEPRGRGLVVTDGKEEVKLSSVAPRVSRANLERRFGAMHGEQQDIGERQSPNGPARTASAHERDAGAAGRGAGDDVEARRAPARAERNGAEPGVHRRDAQAPSRPGGVAPDGRDRPGADRRDDGRNDGGARDPRLDAVRPRGDHRLASAAEAFIRQVDRDERPFDDFVRQAGRGDRAGRFNEFVQQAAQRDLREATSWGDLAGRLLRNGLYLRVHDNDLAVTNGEYSVKTSKVAPGVSHAALAQRFGEPLVVYRDKEPQPQERAASRNTGAPDLRVDAVKRSVDALERRILLERTRDTAAEMLDRARMQLDPHIAKRAQAREAAQRFRAALAKVYRNPAQARQAFYARARSEGVATAARELIHRPERFGALRGVQVGPVRSPERNEALRNTPKLGHLGTEHLRRTREVWANRSEYRQARANVEFQEQRVKQLDAQLARGSGSERIKQFLSRQLRA
ncbi:MAG: relaxase/mobilization nuclease domain-containing protein, partial [Longimicrobiales bacterium]